MEITRYYHGNAYNVEDSHGNVICTFHDLKMAVLVKRYIEGDSLSEEETNIAVGCIELHDEEEQRKETERQQKKEAEKERARMRKEAKAAQMEGGACNG